MDCKKYRICLALLIVAVIAGGMIYYLWGTDSAKEPAEGMLVKQYEIYHDGENA